VLDAAVARLAGEIVRDAIETAIRAQKRNILQEEEEELMSASRRWVTTLRHSSSRILKPYLVY